MSPNLSHIVAETVDTSKLYSKVKSSMPSMKGMNGSRNANATQTGRTLSQKEENLEFLRESLNRSSLEVQLINDRV